MQRFLSILLVLAFLPLVILLPVPVTKEDLSPENRVNLKVTSLWADTVIGLAYFAIPVELAFFSTRLPAFTIYQKAVIILFVCFIMFCGIGHLLDASQAPAYLVLWDRYLTAVISAITAMLSPIVFSYSIIAAGKFQEDRLLVIKQKDMLSDAQAMTQLGNWEVTWESVNIFDTSSDPDADDLLTAELDHNVADPDNLVINASEEWFRVFGIAVTENDHLTIPISRYVALLSDEDRGPSQEVMEKARTYGTPYTIIQRARRENDGEEIFIRGYGKPLRDKNDQIIGLRGTAQDITAEVYTNRELTLAKEEALVESKHKDAFLATMSHELRTPLTSIIGHVDLMEETPLLEDQQEYVSNAKRAATTLLSLINDILDYSKLIAGVVNLEVRSVSLSEILQDVNAIVKDLGREVRLKVDPYEGPLVLGDAVRIRQILLNLVSNAIKFTMPGGFVAVTHQHKTVWLPRRGSGSDSKRKSTTPDNTSELPYEELTIQVRDTGIGMSPFTVGHLFQPFRQADASTNRRFGGTGLGLSIVKRLVEAMKGSVTVESQEGVGTTFTVHLTLAGVPIIDSQLIAPATSPTGQEFPTVRMLRILVAEDNRVTQKLVQRMLKGHYVDVADNGRIAVDLVKNKTQYDLMLCDVNMPILDGLDATREIRQLEKGKELYIIGLTANAFKTDRDNCLRAGMNDYLAKPFSKQVLVNMVTAVAVDSRRG